MSYETLTLDVDADGIALITIDLPDQSMNVWNEALMADFDKAVDEILSNDAIVGAVVTSGKASGFLAGADLGMLGKSKADTMAEAYEGAAALGRMFRKMESGGQDPKALQKGQANAKPFAAAINGLALGGGLEVALACHYRVCADDPKIKLGLPEVLVGLLPGAGGTQRLPRIVGLQAAAPMIMQGSNQNPQAALAMKIVDEVAPADEIVAKAKAWVKANPKTAAPWDRKGFKFPGGAGSMNPKAVPLYVGGAAMALKQSKGVMPQIRAILSCLYEGSMLPIDTALAVEAKYFTTLLAGPTARNMIRTLFLNKQAAEKGAERPKDVPPVKIEKVGVLGAGLMGSGITHVTAKGGMQVIVLDRSPEEAQKAIDYTKKILEKNVKRGKITQDKADEFLARITPTTDYADLADVDLIIEAVFERPDIKADVIKKTEAVIRDDVVFASNTSTLPITGLAKHSRQPEQFIGMHFFSPVERMPLLEIIPGEKTGDLALAAAFDYNRKIRKTPIVVSDVRGFYTNRVVPPYLNEAMLMVTEGISPALIENAALQLGMPVGPLALTDETTLKLGYDIQQSTMEEMGDDYRTTGTEEILDLMVNKLERGGRRFGAGFYDYPEDGSPKRLWQGIHDYYPLLEEQPDVEEVKQRLMFLQLVEAAKCFAEDVVHDPQSADLGAIFGWGFSPWTGGPMSHIDTMGVETFVRTADSLAQKFGERFAPPTAFREMAEQKKALYAKAACPERLTSLAV